jgi:hypothetical protein
MGIIRREPCSEPSNIDSSGFSEPWQKLAARGYEARLALAWMRQRDRVSAWLGKQGQRRFCSPRRSSRCRWARLTLPTARKPAKTRGELLVGLGVSAGLTDWSGDPVSYGALALGMRFYGIITPFAEARVGGGRVDQRMLTFLSIGVAATIPVSKKIAPRVFIGAVHQHEESLAAVAEAPFGALLGIGVGIRHRAGLQLGAGCDFRVYEKDKFVLAIGPELRGAYLTYSSGPSWYGQIGVAANGHFRLF